MEQTLPFLILLLAGQGCRWLAVFPADTDRSLNLYVIYLALPALILDRVPGLDFSTSVLVPVLMPWLVVFCSAGLVYALAKLLHWDRETTGALLLMVPLGNTSFLGIPMVEQYFGGGAVRYALLYDQFGSFLALSTYGTVILALYGTGEKQTLASVLKKILLFPPFMALMVALFLPVGAVPGWVDRLLETTASSLVPVVLVAIGFQVQILLPRRELIPFGAGLLLRLLVVPLLFLYLCRLLGLSGTAVRVAIFETGMPPMVTAGAMASIAGLKPRLTSAMVGLGILIAFGTLPLIYSWSG
ncbi:membrane protein [Desulfolithobacter dissulfuricans]|uniref:Membrane protein n=1 Tax=Desulfolithobacter dissulfuricans TaxID=2795293 RepID=A0A915TXH5_9BACT|nr:AEC family transporter [Desulfolithobacter dissulfuricans]BCO07763.1 membrane protein [Desulfolithobacter dissulfuricans]